MLIHGGFHSRLMSFGRLECLNAKCGHGKPIVFRQLERDRSERKRSQREDSRIRSQSLGEFRRKGCKLCVDVRNERVRRNLFRRAKRRMRLHDQFLPVITGRELRHFLNERSVFLFQPYGRIDGYVISELNGNDLTARKNGEFRTDSHGKPVYLSTRRFLKRLHIDNPLSFQKKTDGKEPFVFLMRPNHIERQLAGLRTSNQFLHDSAFQIFQPFPAPCRYEHGVRKSFDRRCNLRIVSDF